MYNTAALKQDIAQAKLNSIEEVIDIRRVVDSKLYGFPEIIIRSLWKNMKFLDEMRQQK
jgi:hypothetical protein